MWHIPPIHCCFYFLIWICNSFNNLHLLSPEYNRSAFSHWVKSANRSINSALKMSYTCNEHSTRLKVNKSKRLWHRTEKEHQYPSLHLQLSQSPTSFITISISNLYPTFFFPHFGLFNPALIRLSYYFLSNSVTVSPWFSFKAVRRIWKYC